MTAADSSVAGTPHSLSACVIDESWLPAMFEWLTDPYLNHMAHVGPVTHESQQVWLEGLPNRHDYWVRGIVTRDERRIGAFGLRHINTFTAEAFTYVGPEDARGAGVGIWSMQQIEAEAARRGLARIWGIVRVENSPSRRMLRSLGYTTLGPYEDWGLFVEKVVSGRESGEL